MHLSESWSFVRDVPPVIIAPLLQRYPGAEVSVMRSAMDRHYEVLLRRTHQGEIQYVRGCGMGLWAAVYSCLNAAQSAWDVVVADDVAAYCWE